MAKYSDDPKNRDLNIIKVCDWCKEQYHPRKNSYQIVSRFCSADCARKGMRSHMQRPFGKKIDPKFDKNNDD